MIEIKDNTYKGTRIQIGNYKREVIAAMVKKLTDIGFEELHIPAIQYRSVFENKAPLRNA